MVLDLLLIGLGITLEPFPLIAFLLILSAERGIRKGLAFILGWLACLVAVIAAVVLVTGGKPAGAEHRTLHGRRRRQAHRGHRADFCLACGSGAAGAVRVSRRPGWPGSIGSRLWAAAGLAALLQPWPLVAGGAATITQAKLVLRAGLSGADAVLPGRHVKLPDHGAVRGLRRPPLRRPGWSGCACGWTGTGT